MRVLFCKIHCPSICFCKPSSHLYTPSPLKLENTPHAPPPPPEHTRPLPPALPPKVNSLEEGQDSEAHANDNDNGNCNGDVNHPSDNRLKSSLRKTSPESSPLEKKKVQWVDVVGKKLVEIKEFESSEDTDADYGHVSNRGCVCTIL